MMANGQGAEGPSGELVVFYFSAWVLITCAHFVGIQPAVVHLGCCTFMKSR